MESNELINIWNSLSSNQLIDKELAKENIARIIRKKQGKVMQRIRTKVLIDASIYLVAMLALPIVIIVLNFTRALHLETVQLVGIVCVEAYLAYMFLKAYSKFKNLNLSDYSLSIKSSIESLKDKYLKLLAKERVAAYAFSYLLIFIASFQHIIHNGGIEQIEQKSLMIIAAIMLAVPFVLKFEYKIRYTNSIAKLDETIADLSE